MNVELKEIAIEGYKPSSYWPDDEECFSFHIDMHIGIENEDGADDYGLYVMSHKFLEKYHPGPNIFRHTMIISNYNFDKIKSKLESLISECSGESYGECAKYLSRLFSWEFEDYISCEE